MKVVGFQRKCLKFDDGKTVEGVNLYVSEPRTGVTGVVCERVFCSLNRLGEYMPLLGDEIQILYNRFGKVESINLISREVDGL